VPRTSIAPAAAPAAPRTSARRVNSLLATSSTPGAGAFSHGGGPVSSERRDQRETAASLDP
jgi:hypothetical protein